jgi:hypothetical protein
VAAVEKMPMSRRLLDLAEADSVEMTVFISKIFIIQYGQWPGLPT